MSRQQNFCRKCHLPLAGDIRQRGKSFYHFECLAPSDAINNSEEDWSQVAYAMRDSDKTPIAIRRVCDLIGWRIQASGFALPEEKMLLQRYAKGW